MHTSLLATKFYFPQTQANLIARPNLVNQLQTGLQGLLTLISAPAGSGKTTLMSEWRVKYGEQTPVAWISLSTDDNDLARFCLYLSTALDSLHPGLSNEIRPLLEVSEFQNSEEVLTYLINRLSEIKCESILVLDDYHLIELPAIHDTLTFLLNHVPPNLHLVLLTRADPALPLSRLRARGQLTEIRAKQLQFTLDEATKFFNQVMGFSLTNEQVAALEKRTEGWIAGLKLAAISMQGRTDLDEFVSAFAGSNHYIVDYLTDEILSRQPEVVRDFLLKTSILERMNASLCTVLTGELNSQSILEKFERSNLFIIPLDENHTWFRYHHMFAEILRRQLMLNKDRYQPNDLNLLAQNWFEENGFIDEAIHHALVVLNFEDAANLIEKYAFDNIYRSETILVQSWLKGLPKNYISTRPILGVIDAWVSLLGPSVMAKELIEKKLLQLEKTISSESLISNQAGALNILELGWITGQIATIRASLARIFGKDHGKTIEFLIQALYHLPEQEIILQGIIYNNLGASYLAVNSVSEAEGAFIKAKELGESCDGKYTVLFAETHLVEIVKRQGHLRNALDFCRSYFPNYSEFNYSPKVILPMHGALFISMGHIQLDRYDLAEAESNLLRGIDLLKLSGELEILVQGYVCLARLKQTLNDFSSAYNYLETARKLWPDAQVYIDAIKSNFDLTQRICELDKSDQLLQWAWDNSDGLYRNDEIPAIYPSGERQFTILMTVCKIFIAYYPISKLIDPEIIHNYLKNQIYFARLRGWNERVIELSITDALAWQSELDITNALTSIKHAVEIAEIENYILMFSEGGTPLRNLLENLREIIIKQFNKEPSYRIDNMLQFIQRLLKSFPSVSNEIAIVSKDPIEFKSLSKREIEVLQLISTGHYNKEIAAELYISIGTVKRHTVNIFNKLDVKNRTEAVAKAREHRLI